MGKVFSCPECGRMVAAIFPMHICEPTENFKRSKEDVHSAMAVPAAMSATMQETGHATMLDRVKAFHRMLTALTDDWKEWLAVDQRSEEPPKWLKSKEDATFFSDMLLLFDSANIEDITISKKQFFWLRDLYDRSL